MGLTRTNNRGFRDQQLAATPRARTRLYNAQAALLEQQLKPKEIGIIGGETVDINNRAEVSLAGAGLRSREAESAARRNLPSRTVSRGTPGGLGGSTVFSASDNSAAPGQPGQTTGAAPAAPGMNGDPVGDLTNPQFAAPDVTFQGGQYNIMQKANQDFGAGEPRVPMRSAGRDYQSSSSQPFDEYDPDYNVAFRNGGMVGKQRSVKQPGYQSGGKVKMPERPRTDVQMEQDRMAAEAAMDEGMRQGAKKYANPKYPDDAKAMEQEKKKSMRGFASGGCVARKGKARKGMRGYAMGGQIGDEMQDDGRDTVDVRVREGEYLLNPQTVAAFGGGDYEAGTSVLDGIVTATTGEEPGPVPVNEAGEPVQQGMRNGGGVKMGYQTGAQIDMFGRGGAGAGLSPAEIARQQVEQSRLAEAARQAAQRAEEAKMAQPKPRPQPKANPKDLRSPKHIARAEKVGENLRKVYDKVPSLRTVGGLAARAPVVGGLVEAFGTAADDGTGYNIYPGMDNNLTLGELVTQPPGESWDQFSRGGQNIGAALGGGAASTVDTMTGWLPGTDGTNLRSAWDAQMEATYGEETTPAGRAAIAQRAALDAALAKQDDLIAAEGLTREELAAGAPIPESLRAPITEQTKVPPPPGAYGRAFGAGDVDLADAQARGLRPAAEAVAPGGMNIVQNTGGPNGEVIVREDINGVPTFTNLRQGGFDGSARNLQAEADARVAQDRQIGLRNAQVVQQMRDNAPIYTQEGIDNRRAQELAMQQTAMEAASRGASRKNTTDQRVSDYFQDAVLDDEGKVKKYIPNPDKKNMFTAALVQLAPAIKEKYGADFYDLSESKQNEILDGFKESYDETQMAIKAAKQQKLPTDDVLRSGRNSLRYLPGSNIGLGDVWGPEATIGDWMAGAFTDDPLYDGMVKDPRSGARIPALRAIQSSQVGQSQDKLDRFGLTEAREAWLAKQNQ